MRMSRRAGLLASGGGPLVLSYTGTMTYEDSGLFRYFTLTTSGTLSANREFIGDVWICGGGGKGGTGFYQSGSTNGGGGGAGGGHFAQSLSCNLPHSIAVTIGAASANSYFGNLLSADAGSNGTNAPGTTAGGTGGAGGSGGGGGGGRSVAANAGTGDGISTIPFSDTYFTSYPCAGGGGGSNSINNRGGKGGSNGSNGYTGGAGTSAAAGGATGGGTGAAFDAATAATYYGSGGGGGAGQTGKTYGPVGYQGVCFIRVPLTEFAA